MIALLIDMNYSIQMKRKVTARAVILNDGGQLFCVRLKAYGGRQERTYWCTPGGGIDQGESLKSALHREMVEETGIPPVIGNLLYVQQYQLEDEEQLEFFFHVTNTKDYLKINLEAASHAEEEIAEFGFVDPKSTHLLPEFLTKESIREQIDSSLPTKIFNYL